MLRIIDAAATVDEDALMTVDMKQLEMDVGDLFEDDVYDALQIGRAHV